MSRITQRGATGPFDVFHNDTDANDVTYGGQKFDTSDGRELTLVNVGGSNIAAGLLVQSQPQVATDQGLAVTAFASNNITTGTPATITATSAASIAANFYQQGYVEVASGTGVGQLLKIAANSAVTGVGSFTISLENPDGQYLVALDNTSVINLIPNPYANVVVNPTTPTGSVIGATLYALTAANYGYIVSKGLAAVISDASVASVGQSVSPSTTTAGTATQAILHTSVIGNAAATAVSAHASAVYLNV